MGDNTRLAPWSLSSTVPAGLEELVLEHRWQQLATEVKKATEATERRGWGGAGRLGDLTSNLLGVYIYIYR